ncbi:hypothetical protein T4A_7916 [Trichinella pseudospiralis]|uniref:Uncharacterized protein n=2 Tax=Trichinella pseudospiralis TaxID=6337 RepID=A0A0V1EXG0_TRIPS|nr:hypothetical protein T4A_7916 [Trichinella pseudospiralis]
MRLAGDRSIDTGRWSAAACLLIVGARHCLTCTYLPQTVSGWTRPGHAAGHSAMLVSGSYDMSVTVIVWHFCVVLDLSVREEDQCVGATESTRRSELVFRFLRITSSCLGWTLSLPSQLFHNNFHGIRCCDKRAPIDWLVVGRLLRLVFPFNFPTATTDA